MKAQSQRRIFYLNMIAVMTLFIYCSAGGFESSAVQACIEAWPGIPSSVIRLMLTLPALVQSIVMFITGPLVGTKISYRAAAISGMILITLGGCIPFFYHPNWTFILVCRGLGLGCGGGMLGMRNALLLKSVPSDQSSRWIGYGSAIIAVSSVIFSPISGALTTIGWNYPFLVNSGAVLCLIFIFFFLKEPAEKAESSTASSKDNSGISSPRMNQRVWLYTVILFVGTCLLYTVMVGISTFFSEEQLGNAAVAGTCISAYALAGFTINLFLTKLIKKLGKRMLGVCFTVCAAGVSLILFFPSPATALIGFALCGIGYFPVFSLMQLYNGEIQPAEKLVFSSVIVLVGNQLAVFASSFYITICGNVLNYRNSEVSSSYLITIILLLILAAIGLTGKVAPNKNPD